MECLLMRHQILNEMDVSNYMQSYGLLQCEKNKLALYNAKRTDYKIQPKKT